MIRALSLAAAAAFVGCSHVDTQGTRAVGEPAVHHTPTVDRVPVKTSLTLDEAAAPIISAGKFETATFALG